MSELKKVTPAKVASYIVLSLWALTTLYPFVWVILNSFREKGMIRRDSFSIPTIGNGFTLADYEKAMDRFDFGNAYTNSQIVYVLLQKHIIKGLTAGAIKG